MPRKEGGRDGYLVVCCACAMMGCKVRRVGAAGEHSVPTRYVRIQNYGGRHASVRVGTLVFEAIGLKYPTLRLSTL